MTPLVFLIQLLLLGCTLLGLSLLVGLLAIAVAVAIGAVRLFFERGLKLLRGRSIG